jgi:hypothetical protein
MKAVPALAVMLEETLHRDVLSARAALLRNYDPLVQEENALDAAFLIRLRKTAPVDAARQKLATMLPLAKRPLPDWKRRYAKATKRWSATKASAASSPDALGEERAIVCGDPANARRPLVLPQSRSAARRSGHRQSPGAANLRPGGR